MLSAAMMGLIVFGAETFARESSSVGFVMLLAGFVVGAVGGGGAHQALGGGEVAGLVGGRVELYGSGADWCVLRGFPGSKSPD